MAMRAWPKDEQTVDDDPWGKFRGGLAAKTLSTTASTIQVTLPDSFVSATLGDSLLLGSSLDGRTYPRIISALQLLEESDDESIFCGPPSDSEGTALSAEARALKVLGIAHPDDERIAREAARAVAKAEAAEAAERRRLQKAAAAAEAKEAADGEGLKSARDAQPAGQADTDKRRQSAALIQPKGDAAGDNQKFICQFPVGLGDDEEFCLVKRILGKNGNNMRRIAEDCNAKVRLRGIGSGFLEGTDGTEANMPLQLNVSCTDFESYSDAVDRVAALLKDLYKHYRRYARSKGMEPPDVKVALEEVRRDDLHHDTLPQKAQQSQRARERRVRDRERQPQQRDGGAAGAADAGDSEEGTDNSADESKSQARPPTLPGGIPVPTTAAGRRAAARTGGALVAAMASAAAREQDRIDREKQKEKGGDRDRRRGNEVDSRTPGAERSAPSHGSRGSAPIGSPADKPQEWSWDRDWNWDRDREWDQNWSWSSWREADGGGGWDKEKSHCAGWDKEKEGGDWDKEKSHGAGWEKANEGGGREQERSRGTGWDKEKGDGGWHGAGWDQESGAAGIGAAVTKVPPPPPGPPPDDATPTRGKDKSSKGASKDKGKGGKGSSRQR